MNLNSPLVLGFILIDFFFLFHFVFVSENWKGCWKLIENLLNGVLTFWCHDRQQFDSFLWWINWNFYWFQDFFMEKLGLVAVDWLKGWEFWLLVEIRSNFQFKTWNKVGELLNFWKQASFVTEILESWN